MSKFSLTHVPTEQKQYFKKHFGLSVSSLFYFSFTYFSLVLFEF